jgi:hypothetical protein
MVAMDKKAKKRIKALRHRIEILRHKLQGAKQQEDEPGEVRTLEEEIASCLEQIAKYSA